MSLAKAIAISTKGMTFDIVRESNLFPPMHVLNTFFQCGIDDADSDITLQWDSFTLNQSEYDEFFDTFRNKNGERTIDGLGLDGYAEWFSAVAVRNTND